MKFLFKVLCFDAVYLCQDLSGLLLAQHKVLCAAQWGDGAVLLQYILLLQNIGGAGIRTPFKDDDGDECTTTTSKSETLSVQGSTVVELDFQQTE